MAYKDYLQSSHWKKTRESQLKRKSVCQICKSEKNLHVHHGRYSDGSKTILGRERPKLDLFTLCSSCHRHWHNMFSLKEFPRKKILIRLVKLVKHGVPKKHAFNIAKNFPELTSSIIKEAKKRGL